MSGRFGGAWQGASIAISIDGDAKDFDRATRDARRIMQREAREQAKLVRQSEREQQDARRQAWRAAEREQHTQLRRRAQTQAAWEKASNRAQVQAAKEALSAQRVAEAQAARAYQTALDNRHQVAEKYRRRSVAVATAIGRATGLAAGAAAVGFGASIRKGVEFDKTMSKVQALTGALGDDFTALRNQAIELGQTTAFSATEAADAMANLGAAGFKTNQIMAAMPGVLAAAAASGEDMASVSEIMTSTMNGFGLKAQDTAHIADVLAATANASSVSIGDIGLSMKYVAPVAKAANQSLEDVSSALVLLGNNGIKADTAGTAMRAGLLRLASPSADAREWIDRLNVSLFDSEGRMKSMPNVIGQLHSSMGKLTQREQLMAAKALFGLEASPAWLLMINKGPRALSDTSRELRKADGAAKRMGDTMRDNVGGSWDEFTGALESGAIKLSDIFAKDIQNGLKDAARGVGNLTDEVERWAASPKGQQDIADFKQGLRDAAGAAMAVAGAVKDTAGWLLEHRDAVKAAAVSTFVFVGSLKALKAASEAAAAVRGVSVAADAASIALDSAAGRRGGGAGRGAAGAAAEMATLSSRSRLLGGTMRVLGMAVKRVPFGPWGLAISGAATGIALLKTKSDAYPRTSAEVQRNLDSEARKLAELKDRINQLPPRRKVVVTVEHRETTPGAPGGPGGHGTPRPQRQRPGGGLGPRPAPSRKPLPQELEEVNTAHALSRLQDELRGKISASVAEEERLQAKATQAQQRVSDLRTRVDELTQSMREAGASEEEIGSNKQIQTLTNQAKSAKDEWIKYSGQVGTAHTNTTGLQKKLIDAQVLSGQLITKTKGAGDKIRRDLTGNFAFIPKAAHKTADEVRRELMKMTGGPTSRPVAKKMLDDMKDAERYARFGTKDVNEILRLAGYVDPNKKWGKGVDKQVKDANRDVTAGVGEGNRRLQKLGNVQADIGRFRDSLAAKLKALPSFIDGAVGKIVLPLEAAINVLFKGDAFDAGGLPPGVAASLGPFAAAARGAGLLITDGKRPAGTRTASGGISDHASGHAIDVSGPKDAMRGFAELARRMPRSKQVIYSPLGSSEGGGPWHKIGNAAVQRMHYSHVHVAAFNRGGLVPGSGDGDTVPALLEPGEGIINKRAVTALGGPGAIDAINAAIPRFQQGGVVASVTPLGVLRGDVNVGAAALAYAEAQRDPSAGTLRARAAANRERLNALVTLRAQVRAQKALLRPLANKIKGTQREIRRLKKQLKKVKKAQRPGIQARIKHLQASIAPTKKRMQPIIAQINKLNARIERLGGNPESIDQDILSLASDVVSDEHDADELDGPSAQLDAIDEQFAAEEAQLDLEQATAESTPGTGDDAVARQRRIDTLTRKLSATQKVGGVESMRRQAALRSEINQLSATAAEPSEDMQALLEQQRERARIAEEHSRLTEVALNALVGPNDIRTGTGTAPIMNINTLHPGDPRTLDAIARAASNGWTLGNPGMRIPSTTRAVG